MHKTAFAPESAQSTDPFDPPSSLSKLSTMRRMVGARLSESKQTAPHFYMSVDIEIDGVMRLREKIKGEGVENAPTVNDCIIAAAARALIEVPELNARIEDQQIRAFHGVNIGVAVALPTGLVVPVLRNVDKRSLADLSEDMRALAAKARSNKLSPDDYRGGTFTISNLGMFGISEFIAILNPPQAGILALGQASPRPVVRNGEIAVATVLTATVSADHRVVDGVSVARFLQSLQRNLQDPAQMVAAPE